MVMNIKKVIFCTYFLFSLSFENQIDFIIVKKKCIPASNDQISVHTGFAFLSLMVLARNSHTKLHKTKSFEYLEE